MDRRWYRWIRDLQISDPITRQQALLLQFLLIVIIVAIGLATVLKIVIFGAAALTPGSLLPNGALFLIAAGALLMLRRRQLRQAVVLLISALLIGQTLALLTDGLQRNPEQLLVYILPITLAGLLLDRRALLATIGLSLLITSGVAWLEQTSPPPVQEEPPIAATIALFALVVGILGLFLDRFGSAWQAALVSTTALASENARLLRELQE